MTPDESPVWYFAYGSNTDPDRFRGRVGPWSDRLRARLRGFELAFSAAVTSEGGGGAVVFESAASVVHGVAFAITGDQLARLDREEFDPDRDLEGRGRRRDVRVESERGELRAFLYTIEPPGPPLAPSAAYLGHITRGLEDAGYPPAVLDEVRAAARRAGAGR